MKTYCYITGSSSGIGLELVRQLVEEAEVHGYSRRKSLDHPSFHHHTIDLRNTAFVKNLVFQLPDQADKVVLINNAGMIGEIARIGDVDSLTIEETFSVNLVSLALLTNQFIREASLKNYPCIILNISSGAARNPISSWASYCASKAGVDMFSKVVDQELRESGKDHIRIHSVYPGIIDTPMQEHIRASKESDFSSVDRFRSYKEESRLSNPSLIAAQLIGIFKGVHQINDVVFDLRDL